MEYKKITNLLGNITDKVPIFITNEWVGASDQSGENTVLRSKYDLKRQC